MTPEEAEALQRGYHDTREVWAREIGFPYPQRRTSKRKPPPGVLDAIEEDAG